MSALYFTNIERLGSLYRLTKMVIYGTSPATVIVVAEDTFDNVYESVKAASEWVKQNVPKAKPELAKPKFDTFYDYKIKGYKVGGFFLTKLFVIVDDKGREDFTHSISTYDDNLDAALEGQRWVEEMTRRYER